MTAEKREVVVARNTEGLAVISKGLTPGEQVVTDGQLRLVPGDKVDLQQGRTATHIASARGE
jgi:multidrug efflux pump subunit AcrA (membrane-fusion protein)